MIGHYITLQFASKLSSTARPQSAAVLPVLSSSLSFFTFTFVIANGRTLSTSIHLLFAVNTALLFEAMSKEESNKRIKLAMDDRRSTPNVNSTVPEDAEDGCNNNRPIKQEEEEEEDYEQKKRKRDVDDANNTDCGGNTPNIFKKPMKQEEEDAYMATAMATPTDVRNNIDTATANASDVTVAGGEESTFYEEKEKAHDV